MNLREIRENGGRVVQEQGEEAEVRRGEKKRKERENNVSREGKWDVKTHRKERLPGDLPDKGTFELRFED